MIKTYLSRAVKVIVFLSIFAVLMTGCMYVLDYHGDGNEMLYRTYLKEPKDTIDGIFIGNSSINRSWVAPVAWNECGITFFSLSSGNQPIVLAPDIIKAAREEQDIKYAVIDIHPIRSTTYYTAYSPSIRRVADNMPRFSPIRWDLISKGLKYYKDSYKEQDNQEKIDENVAGKEYSFYLRFFQYHSRWQEVDVDDFRKPLNQYKSAYTEPIFYTSYTDMDREELQTEPGGLSESQKKTLQSVIDYATENKFPILFISVPTNMEEEDQKELLEAFEIIKNVDSEYVDCINFNTQEMYDTLGIDWKTDFYDDDHLNYLGAPKLTKYLAKYIQDKYGIEDKRGQKKYSSWDKAYNDYVTKREDTRAALESGEIKLDENGNVIEEVIK